MMADFEAKPGDGPLGTAMLSNSLDGASGGVLARGVGSTPDPVTRAKALDLINRFITLCVA